MSEQYDKIVCNGLKYECLLGIHENERAVKQKIRVDFEAAVAALASQRDEAHEIKCDYFKANLMIDEFLKGRKFNLIETVTHEVADLLLKQFDILDVKVTVTKFPADMPNMDSVSYCCCRKNT